MTLVSTDPPLHGLRQLLYGTTTIKSFHYVHLSPKSDLGEHGHNDTPAAFSRKFLVIWNVTLFHSLSHTMLSSSIVRFDYPIGHDGNVWSLWKILSKASHDAICDVFDASLLSSSTSDAISSACSCFRLAVAISAACFFLHFVRLFWNHTCNKPMKTFVLKPSVTHLFCKVFEDLFQSTRSTRWNSL